MLLALPVAASAADYLGTIEKAAGDLAQGRVEEAQRGFEAARSMDMNDPLAPVGLGYALECGGRLVEARGEFSLALQLDPQCGAAQWAAALSALNGGHLQEALARLNTLARNVPAQSPDLWIALAYTRCAAGDMRGSREALAHLGDRSTLSGPQQSMAALVAGAVAYAAGDYAHAVPSLQDAIAHLPVGSFYDPVQRRRVPLLPGLCLPHPEPMPLVSAASTGPKVRTVANTVRLYLDAFKFPDAQYASFYVDGERLHTTNLPPLHYDWDTRRWRNGYHKVVIRADEGEGLTRGQTEEVLLVHNEGASFPVAYEAQMHAKADAALRQAMVLQTDVLATHYLLGMAQLRLGQTEAAVTALEIVGGYEPDYAQTHKELVAIYAARAGRRVRSVSSVPTSSRKIAITFDDGPNPLYTPPLLDILERYHAHCTMFLVGSQAEAHPDIVREIVEQGHEIADHTYSHANLKTLDRHGVEMELLRNRAVLRRITGKSVELFRPPGGNVDPEVGDVAASLGFTTVFWDVFDSWLQRFDESTVLTRLVNSIKPGSIILLHNGNNKTARIVEPLLEEMVRQGYQMVTVSELLAERMPNVTPPSDAPEAPELKDEDPGNVTIHATQPKRSPTRRNATTPKKTRGAG